MCVHSFEELIDHAPMFVVASKWGHRTNVTAARALIRWNATSGHQSANLRAESAAAIEVAWVLCICKNGGKQKEKRKARNNEGDDGVRHVKTDQIPPPMLKSAI